MEDVVIRIAVIAVIVAILTAIVNKIGKTPKGEKSLQVTKKILATIIIVVLSAIIIFGIFAAISLNS